MKDRTGETGAAAPTLRRLSARGARASALDRLAASFLRVALALVFALAAGGHSAMSAAPAGAGAAGLLALCGAIPPALAGEADDRAASRNASCAHCLVCAAAAPDAPSNAPPFEIEHRVLSASVVLLVARSLPWERRRARAPPV